MNTKIKSFILCLTVVTGCVIMMLTDGIWQPGYTAKSAVKIAAFLLLPMLVARITGFSATACLRPDKVSVIKGGLLGIGTALVILLAYGLLSPYIDLSAVPEALEADSGITKDNFLFVATYIALCNSFLEEFFFRGFAWSCLSRHTGKTFACVFSSVCFAVYHAGMLITMVNTALFILALIALVGCGLFFIFLNSRNSIWASWLVHMGANIGINLIGMMLLGVV